MNHTEVKELLDTYEEIVKEIEDYEIGNRIRAIRAAMDDNRYVLSFMGQFSAGKSRLLNSLLKRDILPVHVTETTAVITWIRYGEYENASVRLTNGRSRKIELEEIKSLWQKGALPDGLCMEEIESIDICLDSELLKNGLILADTPGINTLVKRHEALAMQLLESTEEIIYVTAKQITGDDVLYIRNMVNHGIPVSFVRTHMDEVRDTEESAEEIMRIETESLQKEVEQPHVFFVSAEESSRFYSAIEEVRKYVGQTIAANVSRRFEQSCESRMEVIERLLAFRIREMLGEVTKVKNREKSSFESKAGMLFIKINAMESSLEYRRQKIRDGFENAKKAARNNAKQCAERLTDSFDCYLDNLRNMEQYEEEIQREAQKRIGEAGNRIRTAYNSAFDEFIRGNSAEMLNEADMREADIPFMPLPQKVDDLIRERMENDMVRRELCGRIQETLELVERLQEELEGLDKESEGYEAAKAALEQAVLEAKEAEAELGPYIPQYYMDESNVKGLGDMMRGVGKVLDWATLLIPGPVYAKAAEKIGQCGAKAAKAASTVISAVGKADKFKDIAYIFQNIKDIKVSKKTAEKYGKGVEDYVKEVKEKAEGAGVLDLLTIEYWMGVLGDKLDGKPVRRENLAYRNEYEKAKQMVELRLQEQMRKQLDMKEQYGLIKNRQERAVEEQKIREEQRQSLEKELKAQEYHIREKAKETAFAAYKKECSRWFAEIMAQMSSDKVLNGMEENAEAIGRQYEERCTGNLMNELKGIEQDYKESADKLKALDNDELQGRIQVYTEYLQKLGA